MKIIRRRQCRIWRRSTVASPTQVFAIVAQIPSGMVTTYGDIARALGDPRGADRSAGRSPARRLVSDLPFHRVVNREGFLSGGWAFGHPEVMKQRLLAEGVPFSDEYTVDHAPMPMDSWNWTQPPPTKWTISSKSPSSTIVSGKVERLMISPFRSTTTRRSWSSRPARNPGRVVPAGSSTSLPLMVAAIVSVFGCGHGLLQCAAVSIDNVFCGRKSW